MCVGEIRVQFNEQRSGLRLQFYVGLAHSTLVDSQFLIEITKCTGCGQLDVNNVFVSTHKPSFDAEAYVATLPGEAITFPVADKPSSFRARTGTFRLSRLM